MTQEKSWIHAAHSDDELRADQAEDLLLVRDEFQTHDRVLVSAPTGSGKSVLACGFVNLMDARRVLVLAQAEQVVAHLVRQFRDWVGDVGMVKAARHEPDHRVVVASVQSLSRENRLREVKGPFDLIVIDEGHHATADSYTKILEHYGGFDGVPVVGWTATPMRADKAQLISNEGQEGVFQKRLILRDLQAMILAGLCPDIVGVRRETQLDLSKVKMIGKDFSEGDLERQMRKDHIAEEIVSAWREECSGRKGLVFVPGVTLAQEVADELSGAGFPFGFMSGSTPVSERTRILADLEDGRLEGVVNCMVLGEGADLPYVDCIVLARPTKSLVLYRQMIGRATRRYPGKKNALVVDLVGATEVHDLISLEQAVGVDPATFRAANGSVEAALSMAIETGELDFDGRTISKVVDLFEGSDEVWVKSLEGSLYSVGFIDRNQVPRILYLARDRNGDRGIGIVVIAANSFDPHPEFVGWADTWDMAMAEGRVYLSNHASHAEKLFRRDQAWRLAPATKAQRNMVKMLGGSLPRNATKGDAAEEITKRQIARFQKEMRARKG